MNMSVNREAQGVKKKQTLGFTLTELLCTLLILALVMTSAVTGMTALAGAYRRTMEKSQAEELCATLSASFTHELSFAKYVKTDASGNVTGFYSDTYRTCHYVVLNKDYPSGALWTTSASGKLAIYTDSYTPLAGQNLYVLVADDAYAPDLTVKISRFTYADEKFTLTLVVSSSSQPELSTVTLTILNLNAAYKA